MIGHLVHLDTAVEPIAGWSGLCWSSVQALHDDPGYIRLSTSRNNDGFSAQSDSLPAPLTREQSHFQRGRSNTQQAVPPPNTPMGLSQRPTAAKESGLITSRAHPLAPRRSLASPPSGQLLASQASGFLVNFLLGVSQRRYSRPALLPSSQREPIL